MVQNHCSSAASSHCHGVVIKEISRYSRKVCRQHQKVVWKGRGLMVQYIRATGMAHKQSIQRRMDKLTYSACALQDKIDKSEVLLHSLLEQEKQTVHLLS